MTGMGREIHSTRQIAQAKYKILLLTSKIYFWMKTKTFFLRKYLKK